MSSETRSPLEEGDSVSRNAVLALAAQLVPAAFTAALVIFLANQLHKQGYGLFSLAAALGAVLVLLADAGMSASAARFIAEHRGDRDAVVGILSGALRVKLLVCIAIAAALFALASPIASVYGIRGLAWPLRGIAVATLGQGLMMLYQSSFITLRRVSLALRVVLAESTVELSASVAIVLLGGGAAGAAFGRAAGYIFAALFAALLAVRLLGRQAAAPPGSFTRRVLRYAGVLFVVDTAFTLFEQLDLIVIGAFLGASPVALYQVPLRLATFMHSGGLAGANAVAPRLARSPTSEPDSGAFLSALRWLVLIQAALMAPVVLWATPLLALVVPGYGQSAGVLQGLAPYIFLSGFAPLVTLGVNYLGAARRRVPIAIGAVVANLLVDVLLIPRIGIVAGAIGSDIGYGIYVPAHLWLCRRMLDVDLRPLAGVLLRAGVAAAAMAGVLALAGTGATVLRELIPLLLGARSGAGEYPSRHRLSADH